jgi:hypothetical protein
MAGLPRAFNVGEKLSVDGSLSLHLSYRRLMVLDVSRARCGGRRDNMSRYLVVGQGQHVP